MVTFFTLAVFWPAQGIAQALTATYQDVEPSHIYWPTPQNITDTVGFGSFFWCLNGNTSCAINQPNVLDTVEGFISNYQGFGGALANANFPAFKFQFENAYLDTAGSLNTEMNWDYTPGFSGTGWRPWHFTLVTPPPGSTITPYLYGELFATAADRSVGRYMMQLSPTGAFFGMPQGFTAAQLSAGNDTSSTDTGQYAGVYGGIRPSFTIGGASSSTYIGAVGEAIYDRAATGAVSLGPLIGGLSTVSIGGPGSASRTFHGNVAGHSVSVSINPTGSTPDIFHGAVYGIELAGLNQTGPDFFQSYVGLNFGSPVVSGTGGTFDYQHIHLADVNPSGTRAGFNRSNAIAVDVQNVGNDNGGTGNMEWFGGHWNDGHIAFVDGGGIGGWTGKNHLYVDDTTSGLAGAVPRWFTGGAPTAANSGNAILTGSASSTWGVMLWGDGATVTTGTAACQKAGLTCTTNGVRLFSNMGTQIACGTANTAAFAVQCQ